MSIPNGISIVICTYNGLERIRPTLESIFSQKTQIDFDWELVIVDNASSDGTSDFCKSLIEANGFNHKSKIVYESEQGCNHARLRGLREVQYKWLLFCDDDNHLFPDYLQNAFKILNDNSSIGVLGGQGIPLFEDHKPEWFDQYASSYAIGAQSNNDGKIKIGNKRHLYSAGSFFRKDVLMRYYNQGFTTIMVGPNGKELTRGEDTEWCLMIQLAGYDLWYSSSLKFHHFMSKARMTWEYYLKLKEGIAAGESKLFSYHLFFTSKNPGNHQFYFSYLKAQVYYNLVWIHFRIRSKIQASRYSKDLLSLGKVINSTKARTFNRDYIASYNQFKKIRKLVNLI